MKKWCCLRQQQSLLSLTTFLNSCTHMAATNVFNQPYYSVYWLTPIMSKLPNYSNSNYSGYHYRAIKFTSNL